MLERKTAAKTFIWFTLPFIKVFMFFRLYIKCLAYAQKYYPQNEDMNLYFSYNTNRFSNKSITVTYVVCEQIVAYI